MNEMPRVLIEDCLPIDKVGAESWRDASAARKPPLNRLHVWWARRPLAVFACLCVSRCGMIINYPLLPARPHGSQLLDDLIADFEGVIPADKVFVNHFRRENLARKRHVELIVPVRKNMEEQLPRSILKTCSRWRKVVECVFINLQLGRPPLHLEDLVTV